MTWRFKPVDEMPRLHPQSWSELRQLVKLHGAKAIHRAVDEIERQEREGK